jgi:hypothetical protein
MDHCSVILILRSEATKDLWLDRRRMWFRELPVEPKILRFARDRVAA